MKIRKNEATDREIRLRLSAEAPAREDRLRKVFIILMFAKVYGKTFLLIARLSEGVTPVSEYATRVGKPENPSFSFRNALKLKY